MSGSAPDRVQAQAHAKVNLLLRILARESSGYHQIETVFQLLELADKIEVTRTAGGVTLDVRGPDLGPVEDNLAVRAAQLVLDATGRKFGVAIALTKHIPVRAGLGGGSSDAARVLHAVNALAAHAVPRHELEQLGTRLGADVAFFTSGAATALAWGRGERLYRLAAPPVAPVLIAVPAVTVSTPEAYRWWDEMHPEPAARGPVVLDAEALGTWGSIGRLGGNDFEVPVFSRHPTLRAVFERLAQTAPLWVRLCGSGAAVGAVYRTARDRDDAALTLDAKLAKPIATTTRTTAAA
ncbi:MAG TPA: 4-(cytidine 5'-diphospho)-2-C-methyl-D-erythritol kinase [Gemmatimonadales bacterium]|nr:4-(cytidine 5'-diphospho)-2-C-methyl-D-erythritol kinase [Gemmatimonadales bacterium]